ncbi:hypothetical protein D3C77_562120 [compost metagenome]
MQSIAEQTPPEKIESIMESYKVYKLDVPEVSLDQKRHVLKGESLTTYYRTRGYTHALISGFCVFIILY